MSTRKETCRQCGEGKVCFGISEITGQTEGECNICHFHCGETQDIPFTADLDSAEDVIHLSKNK